MNGTVARTDRYRCMGEYVNARRTRAQKIVDTLLRRYVAVLGLRFKMGPDELLSRILARKDSGERSCDP
jgi:hypothetical protein